jgi:hypothetical protein
MIVRKDRSQDWQGEERIEDRMNNRRKGQRTK